MYKILEVVIILLLSVVVPCAIISMFLKNILKETVDYYFSQLKQYDDNKKALK